ncbi:hypothetical protein PSN45_002778 [Yamadazyma tenuis]|nr:hypothetical protein PSN45_002778 [Yamadazyma tenuis]
MASHSARLRKKPPPPLDFDDPSLPSPSANSIRDFTGGSRGPSAVKKSKQDDDHFNNIINHLENELDQVNVASTNEHIHGSNSIYGDRSVSPNSFEEMSPLNTARPMGPKPLTYASTGSFSFSGTSSTYPENDDTESEPDIAISPNPRYSLHAQYSDSSQSVGSRNNTSAPPPIIGAPYPMDSPIAPSPTSISYNDSYISSSNSTSDSPQLTAQTGSGIYSSPHKSSRTPSQTTTNTTKSVPLKPLISTPIINMTNDSFRNSSASNLNNSIPNMRNHRKSSSLSSIWSSSSSKNVNLATLKKTFDLRPGEGERSNYVLSVRKSAGTAYNETGPGKWKLPTGIMPLDKKNTYTTSNSKYMRLVGGVSQSKLKKGTGVELKHGHLAPRLLAAEVDDRDDISINFGRKASIAKAPINDSIPETAQSTPTQRSVSTFVSTPGAASFDSKISLSRTITDNSTQSKTPSTNVSIRSASVSRRSTRQSSISSSSSGSISDVCGNGFYQHRAYKYTEEFEEGDTDEKFDEDNTEELNYEVEKSQPMLVLANPDASDSD